MSVRTDVINLNVNINGNAAQNQLIELRKRASDITLEMKGLKKGTEEYKAAAKDLSQVTAQMSDLKKQVGITALTQKELTAELRKLNALKGSVQPFSQEFKDLQKQINAVQSRLYDVRNGVTGLASVFSKVKDEVKQFGTLALSYLGFQFLTSQFKNIVQGAGRLSDQLADLRRVSGLTADEVNNLNHGLSQLDTRTSTSGLRDIAIVAGKLGVAKEDILGFTKAVDMLVVALGDELGNADEITTQLGKILNVFDGKITGDNISKLGNAIVDLANKGVATGGFIVDFTQRLSGIAKTSNITLPALLGLGAGLEETGAKVESASTAISKLVVNIAQDIPKAAKIAGATTQEEIQKFADTFAKAPQEALLQYAAGLQKNKKDFAEIANSFKDAGESGARVVTTLATIGNKADFFREKMKEAGNAIKDTTAIQQAFALKNEDFGAILDKIGKQFFAFVQSSGVSNFLKSLAEGFSSFLETLKNLPQFINENKGAIYALIVAFLAYNAAMIKSAVVSTALFLEQKALALGYKLITAAEAIAEAATASYIVVTNLLTGKIKLATAAQRLWNIASSLGAGAVSALIVAGVALVEVLSHIFEDNSKIAIQMKAQADLAQKAADSYGNQVNKLEILKQALEAENVGLDAKKKAYQELIAMNPDFVKTLSLDAQGHLQGAYAIDEYIKSLKKKAEAEAAETLSNEKNQEILRLEQEKYNKTLKEAGVIKALGHGSAAYQSDIAEIDKKIDELKTAKEFFDQKIIAALNPSGSGSVFLPPDTAGANKQAVTKEDPSVAARRAQLQKMIDDSKAAYEQLNANDKAGQLANLALREKYQKELDALDNKKDKNGTTESEYKRLKKEAEDFYKSLKKLKEDAAAADKSQDEKDLVNLEQKYNDLHAKALEFYQKNIIDRKTYTEEEKTIVESFNQELAALQKKQFETRSENEYKQALQDTQDYFDHERNLEGKRYADGKQSKAQYDAEIKDLDEKEKAQLLQVAEDYSKTSKSAAADVTKFKKDQEKQQTDDAIAGAEARKKTAEEEAIAKAKLAVLKAPQGSKQQQEAQKALLQEQFNQDTQYLDKKSQVYLEKEAELQAAIAQIDDDFRQRRIEALDQATQQMLSIAGNLITALNNLDQRQLQKDKKINDAKLANYKYQLDHKLISQKQYDAKVQAANDEMDKKKKEMDLKAFKRQQALAIVGALINGAMAVTSTLAARPGLADIFTLGVARAIQVGLVVAATAAQVAAIASQAPPTAAKGNWFRKGDKHSDPSGGIPVMIERDEAVVKADAMTDTNKYTVTGTPAQITSKLNAMHGGVDWAAGAQINPPKFMQRPPSINPNMPRIMANGGLGLPRQINTANNTNDELFMKMIAKQDELITEVKNQKKVLHAVVSIKEYRDTEELYDNARKASGMSQ